MESAGADCNYYDTSAGSCYEHGVGVTCDVKQSTCEAAGKTYYAPGFVGSSGCCHCDESCDHTLETGTDCHLNYYDVAQSDGSCYDSTAHVVTCDVAHQKCHDSGGYWYKPGYMSTSRTTGLKCCHCKDSCDHTAETGANCEESWYDASPAPTTAPVAKVVAADAATATTVGVLAAAAAGAAALL